jgi:twitching motility two-component system response regulator PilG
MSTKTRVLNVRVVGFSAPERQMLNSIFLLSVAPARQIGYKLWNPEAGVAPDMYLLDGDSESAVASWQATFSSTSDRTLVVGSKNTDVGVAAASRPLGLKVVGAMDRLAIALNNVREAAGLDVSEPRAGTLPTSAASTGPSNTSSRLSTGMTAQQPALSASMNSMAPMSATSHGMTASSAAAVQGGTLPTSMTAAAPAATVLPNMTLQPNVAPPLDRSLNEKPVTEKSVDRILSEKPADKTLVEKTPAEKILSSAAALAASGVTPLSPSALSAAVAPSTSTTRANLRVVPNPSSMSASLPAAARIADAPMVPPPMAPVPVAAAPAPAPLPLPIPVAPISSAPTPRHEEHNFRVLAVDDSPLMRTFLQNKLQPYGITPEFAASGEEALFKISKQHFDMIFLDVMLPGMDGYDVCKMIKKNKDNSLMKVVMLTSKDKTFDKIRGTMAGCDGYLTKPVDELKLRSIIERHTVTKK